MPSYDFQNTETGEVQTEILKIAELDEFKKNNPHLRQILGMPSTISDSKSTLRRAGSEWGNLLTKIKKGAGYRVKNTIND